MPPFKNTRHDQGTNKGATDYTKVVGLGPTTSHFRHGPNKPFAVLDLFPDQGNGYHFPEIPPVYIIEEPTHFPVDQQDTQKVPDSGLFVLPALLAVVAFKALCLGRGKK